MTKIEKIAKRADKNDLVSWQRKMTNLVALLAELRPIEDEIMNLKCKQLPIFDEIAELRIKMVETCVHPIEHLVEQSDGTIRCSFCEKRFMVIEDDRTDSKQPD